MSVRKKQLIACEAFSTIGSRSLKLVLRIIGTPDFSCHFLSQLVSFEAFNIVQGDSMYVSPENRVRIW